jgi:hypothetical protein
MQANFFVAPAPEPSYYDNKRSYHRYTMRCKAVLKRGPSLLGTFTKDLSRQGVAFLGQFPAHFWRCPHRLRPQGGEDGR